MLKSRKLRQTLALKQKLRYYCAMYVRLRIFESCGLGMSESRIFKEEQIFILRTFDDLLTNALRCGFIDSRLSTLDSRQGNLCALASCLKRKNSFQYNHALFFLFLLQFHLFITFITSNANTIAFTFLSSQNHAGLNLFAKRQSAFNPVCHKSNRSLQTQSLRAYRERKTRNRESGKAVRGQIW